MKTKTITISRGKWEITLRNLRAIKKDIAKLDTRIRRLEKKMK